MRLSINLASRGRPELLIETVKRTLSNISRADTVLVVSLDADDEASQQAINGVRGNANCVISCEKREDSLGAKYNRILASSPADVYLAMVDYAPHITPGFDQKILDAAGQFPDGIGVIYNHMANAAFPGINAVTAGLVRRMGFFYPPYFPVWFIDHWLDDIARMIGRIAYADIEIDTTNRPGTQNLRDLPFWCEFYDRLAPMREECAARIINDGAFECLPWMCEFLPTTFPLTRQRSVMINRIAVQQNAGAGPYVEDNERHQRLRAAAQEMVKALGQPPIEAPQERPRRHPLGVVFATPCLTGQVATEFEDSTKQTMLALAWHGIPFEFMKVNGDPFVDHARNKLATWFLDMYPDAENFFFLDDDIGWPAEKVIEFLKRDEPILVGIYQKKQKERDFPVEIEIANGELVERDGLLKAAMAPTGFMRIKRWVLEKLSAEYEKFEEMHDDGKMRNYSAIFLHGIGPDRMWWGEDGAFVTRCAALGIETWVDPDVEISHRGSWVWKTKLQDHLPVFRRKAKRSVSKRRA